MVNGLLLTWLNSKALAAITVKYQNITIPSSGYVLFKDADEGLPIDENKILFTTIVSSSASAYTFSLSRIGVTGTPGIKINQCYVRFWYIK